MENRSKLVLIFIVPGRLKYIFVEKWPRNPRLGENYVKYLDFSGRYGFGTDIQSTASKIFSFYLPSMLRIDVYIGKLPFAFGQTRTRNI